LAESDDSQDGLFSLCGPSVRGASVQTVFVKDNGGFRAIG
jgi:hypothetical protein